MKRHFLVFDLYNLEITASEDFELTENNIFLENIEFVGLVINRGIKGGIRTASTLEEYVQSKNIFFCTYIFNIESVRGRKEFFLLILSKHGYSQLLTDCNISIDNKITPGFKEEIKKKIRSLIRGHEQGIFSKFLKKTNLLIYTSKENHNAIIKVIPRFHDDSIISEKFFTYLETNGIQIRWFYFKDYNTYYCMFNFFELKKQVHEKFSLFNTTYINKTDEFQKALDFMMKSGFFHIDSSLEPNELGPDLLEYDADLEGMLEEKDSFSPDAQFYMPFNFTPENTVNDNLEKEVNNSFYNNSQNFFLKNHENELVPMEDMANSSLSPQNNYLWFQEEPKRLKAENVEVNYTNFPISSGSFESIEEFLKYFIKSYSFLHCLYINSQGELPKLAKIWFSILKTNLEYSGYKYFIDNSGNIVFDRLNVISPPSSLQYNS